jgi:hypothetical protein
MAWSIWLFTLVLRHLILQSITGLVISAWPEWFAQDRPAKSDLFLIALIRVTNRYRLSLHHFLDFRIEDLPSPKRAGYCLLTTSQMRNQRGQH